MANTTAISEIQESTNINNKVNQTKCLKDIHWWYICPGGKHNDQDIGFHTKDPELPKQSWEKRTKLET